MQYMYAACQGYKEHSISSIAFVQSNYSLTHELTKRMNQEAIRNATISGKLNIDVVRWIIRKPK